MHPTYTADLALALVAERQAELRRASAPLHARRARGRRRFGRRGRPSPRGHLDVTPTPSQQTSRHPVPHTNHTHTNRRTTR